LFGVGAVLLTDLNLDQTRMARSDKATTSSNIGRLTAKPVRAAG
jgi:hypothetical protein